MRVLIADKLPGSTAERLGSLGLTVLNQPDVDVAGLPAAARDCSVLVVRGKRVTADVFAAAPGLSLVIRAGAGVNTIDLEAASRHGVYVSNCPGRNAVAVAELAFGLMLALDRHIPDNVAALRAGRWDKKRFGTGRGLKGRRLGVVGLGAIGRAVVARAQAFEMQVLAWSRSLNDQTARQLGVVRAATLSDLAPQSDLVSVHLPLAPETRGIIDAAFIEALPKGALFINTARAEVVDQEALLAAVRAGRVRAGTDVFAKEPAGSQGEFADPLGVQEGVYGTHHIGASTAQAEEATAEEVVRIVTSFVRTGHVPNCVNLCARSPARHQLIVRHLDRVGVLAHVLGALREAQINVQEMENNVFEGAAAAVARIKLDSAPTSAQLDAVRANPHVLHVDLVDV
jgi:D-3-phosphoglycerate dehydrogenase